MNPESNRNTERYSSRGIDAMSTHLIEETARITEAQFLATGAQQLAETIPDVGIQSLLKNLSAAAEHELHLREQLRSMIKLSLDKTIIHDDEEAQDGEIVEESVQVKPRAGEHVENIATLENMIEEAHNQTVFLHDSLRDNFPEANNQLNVVFRNLRQQN